MFEEEEKGVKFARYRGCGIFKLKRKQQVPPVGFLHTGLAGGCNFTLRDANFSLGIFALPNEH